MAFKDQIIQHGKAQVDAMFAREKQMADGLKKRFGSDTEFFIDPRSVEAGDFLLMITWMNSDVSSDSDSPKEDGLSFNLKVRPKKVTKKVSWQDLEDIYNKLVTDGYELIPEYDSFAEIIKDESGIMCWRITDTAGFLAFDKVTIYYCAEVEVKIKPFDPENPIL